MIHKIICKPEDNLMHAAYSKLKITDNSNNDIRYNQYSQVKHFFVSHDMELEFNNLNPLYKRKFLQISW